MKLMKVLGDHSEYVDVESVRAFFIKPTGNVHDLKFQVAGRIDNTVYIFTLPASRSLAEAQLEALVNQLGVFSPVSDSVALGGIVKRPVGRPKKIS